VRLAVGHEREEGVERGAQGGGELFVRDDVVRERERGDRGRAGGEGHDADFPALAGLCNGESADRRAFARKRARGTRIVTN
jgi:hypothetical protein